MAAKTLAKGIIEFVKIIGSEAPAVGKAIKDLLFAIIDVIVTMTPAIIEAGVKFIIAFLKE